MIRFGPQHEVMHTLGAVHPGAPHYGDGGHCTDDLDAMCFGPIVCGDDSFASFAANKILFDCNADDYFAVSPPPGSYLDTHWNTYDSSFLVRTDVPTVVKPDTVKPTAEILRVKVNKAKRKAKIRFTGADDVTDPGALEFRCKLDRKRARPCTSPKVYRNLKPGRHRVKLRAIDAAGNASPFVKKKFRIRRGRAPLGAP